jgi:hypothetical protein
VLKLFEFLDVLSMHMLPSVNSRFNGQLKLDIEWPDIIAA